ncbi:MAG: AI-2E family transporter [Defluviitaleaceae bacterium]|nr:AI-2E family transporter [Defluviitaleaceae bacterium]
MTNKYLSRKLKELLPFFILAFGIIVMYRVSGEMEFFFSTIQRAWEIVLPFIYGFILAYIVNMPMGGVQRLLAKSSNKFILKKQRMLSVIIVAILFLGLIALALNFIIPAIVDSVTFFIAQTPTYWANIVYFVESFNEMELFGWYVNAETIFVFLGDMFADFNLEDLIQPLTALMGVGTALFNGVIAFISTIYVLIEKDKFKAFMHKTLKAFSTEGFYTTTMVIVTRLNHNFRQYIRTQTIDGIILGTMATIFLWIIGSPFAIILGIMLGIVNYIPYFGSIFGTLVAVIVVAFTQGIGMGAIAAIALFIIQQIDANIVQPRLMSGSFSLSPLLVIISITVGGAMAGIMGMLVAIPIVAVLKDIFDSIVEYYEIRKAAAQSEQNDS